MTVWCERRISSYYVRYVHMQAMSKGDPYGVYGIACVRKLSCPPLTPSIKYLQNHLRRRAMRVSSCSGTLGRARGASSCKHEWSSKLRQAKTIMQACMCAPTCIYEPHLVWPRALVRHGLDLGHVPEGTGFASHQAAEGSGPRACGGSGCHGSPGLLHSQHAHVTTPACRRSQPTATPCLLAS